MQNQSAAPSEKVWQSNKPKLAANTTLFWAISHALMQHHRATGKPLQILSLPAATLEWEQAFDKEFRHIPMCFLGLERDAIVHKKAKRFAAGLPKRFAMTEEPVDFHTFAKTNNRRRPFDVIYLDWMGTWSQEKEKDITALFRHSLLAVGGILIMTVSTRRGQPVTNNKLKLLAQASPAAFIDARGEDKYIDNDKVRGIPIWIQGHAEENHGIRMRHIIGSVYYSRGDTSTQTQPQLQLMMQRET